MYVSIQPATGGNQNREAGWLVGESLSASYTLNQGFPEG